MSAEDEIDNIPSIEVPKNGVRDFECLISYVLHDIMIGLLSYRLAC